MGFFSQFAGRADREPLLALDIGTEVVKALVFQMNHKDVQGAVLGVGRAWQRLGNMQSGAVSDISGVIETAQQAIEKAQEQAGVKKVRKAIMGIAGELVKGTTTTVHYERVDPEVRIDMAELKNIIHRVQEKAYERIESQLEWETGHRMDIKLINAAIVDVRIDGYRITNPIGFQGREVSISVFNAYAPLLHLGALESIARALNVDLLNIAAEPYAVSMAVHFEDVMDFNAIFVDIGGGTTDIAVVRNGGLEGTKMFALGGRAFTKRIMQSFGVQFEAAEKAKLEYAYGTMDEAGTARIEKVLEDDCQVWLGGVEISLAEFSESNLLPTTMYLCGGGSGLPGIQKALLSDEWTKNLPFAKQPEIRYLQPKDVMRVVDKTGELTNPQDVTPMSLASLAVDLAHEEKVVASMLRKAMQSIE